MYRIRRVELESELREAIKAAPEDIQEQLASQFVFERERGWDKLVPLLVQIIHNDSRMVINTDHGIWGEHEDWPEGTIGES